ncbi:uncharacterized protein [Antedon mediterranea]|uniref:uncharacterized protein n=1 Tax=Antedon mediterranea TaxID=105859 RepID=UPI003AF64FEA
MEETDLLKRLTDRNRYFNQMVNLIPAKFYFSNEDKQYGFYGKESSGKVPSHKIQKSKKKKLDPAQHKSVTKIQEVLAEKEETERAEQERTKDNPEITTQVENLDIHDHTDEFKKKIPTKPISVEKINSSESIEELREKLHVKIARMKNKRNTLDNTNNGIPTKLLRKLSQDQKQERLEAIKKSKKELKKASVNKKSKGDEADKPTAPPVLNSEGEVVFSKFEFTNSSEKKKKWVKKNQPRSNRDYTRLLMKAEMDAKKMKELKETDPEKAKQTAESQAWKKALLKAEGTKVKDDPNLIKQTMKKQKKIKQKSAKQWNERIEQQEKTKKDKQEKRTKNIQSRKDQKQKKKVKRLQKKGKLLPGF